MKQMEDFPIQEPAYRIRKTSRPWAIWLLGLGLIAGFIVGLMLAVPLGLGGPTSTKLFDEGMVTSLFEMASPAVVEIHVNRRSGRVGLPAVDTGSGFLIDDQGHIVTNHHVVEGPGDITVRLHDGRILEARRLGTSPADDLALLLVEAEDVEGIDPLPLADSDKVKPGQMAIAIGSPFRQFNSLTVGVVSGTGRGPASVLRRPIPDMIQTDAPLNPGNSGGPLLNRHGEVIGVNSSVRTSASGGREEYRLGFAVPSNTLSDLLPQLLESRQVRRPWLGISGGSVSQELANAVGLPKGVYVTGVFRGSPAAEVGIVPFSTLRGSARGDVITAIDGTNVDSIEDMVSYFNKVEPGEQVTLSVFRDGGTIEIEVALVEWPDT